MDLQPDSTVQLCFSLGDEEPVSRTHLMQALDSLNLRYGRGTVRLASAGTAGNKRTWLMQQNRLSPSYTTDWEAIVIAR